MSGLLRKKSRIILLILLISVFSKTEAANLLEEYQTLFFLKNSKTRNSSPLSIEYFIKVSKDYKECFWVKAKFSGIASGSFYLKMTENYGKVNKLEEIIPEFTLMSPKREEVNIKKINEFEWYFNLYGKKELFIDYLVNTKFPYSSFNMVRLPYRDENHLYLPASSVFIFPDVNYLRENNMFIKSIKINFDLPTGWIAATSWGLNKTAYDIIPPTIENLNSGIIGVGCYKTYSCTVNKIIINTAILGNKTLNDEVINHDILQALQAGFRIFHFFPKPRFFALIHFTFDKKARGSGNTLGWSLNLNYGRNLNYNDWLENRAHIFHEIFHFWNGVEEAPISRDQDDYSTIWFSEGITRFYQYKNMYASGLISEEEYLHSISNEFNKVFHSSRQKDNLDIISLDYYDEYQARMLTYSKGCCLAFALDLLLNNIDSEQKSFDDLLKIILQRYDYRTKGQCYTHEDLDSIFREVLGESHFKSYKRLYGKYFIAEFKSILNSAGLEIKKKIGNKLYFGITNFAPENNIHILEIDKESSAYKAGLREDDILLEINGSKISKLDDLKAYLNTVTEKEIAELLIQRGKIKLRIQTPCYSYQTLFEIRRKLLNDKINAAKRKKY